MTSDHHLDVARLLAERGRFERLARRLVRDPAMAEDLAQETLRRALEPVEPKVHVRGWLALVLRRLAVDLLLGLDEPERSAVVLRSGVGRRG